MSTCVPTPVSTAFSTVIGNSITTTYSLTTSAAPPVVTTHVDSYCENEAVVLDSAVCLKTGTRTGTETLQGTLPLLPRPHDFNSSLCVPHAFISSFSVSSDSKKLTLLPSPAISIHSSTAAAHNDHTRLLTPTRIALRPHSTPLKYSCLGRCLHRHIRNRGTVYQLCSYQHILWRLLGHSSQSGRKQSRRGFQPRTQQRFKLQPKQPRLKLQLGKQHQFRVQR